MRFFLGNSSISGASSRAGSASVLVINRVIVSAATLMMMSMSVTACTFFSGVEELELRPNTPPDASTTSSDTSPGPAPTTPPAFSLSGDGGVGTSTGKPARPGSEVCGATGTWTTCEVPDTLTTCALRCQAKGLSCVESCCAYDNVGDYAAKAGMVYTSTALNACDLSSVPSTSSAGLCSDPILPIGAMDIRCCCR